MASLRRVPRILFLIADTGGGHRAAANAVRAAMDLIAPETRASERDEATPRESGSLPVQVHTMLPGSWGGAVRPWSAYVVEIFQECGPLAVRRASTLYGPTVTKRPYVWAGLYHATNTRPTYAALSLFTRTLLQRGLRELLEKMQPDVIVSVHSL